MNESDMPTEAIFFLIGYASATVVAALFAHACFGKPHHCRFRPTGQWSDKGVGIEGRCRCGKTTNLPC